MKNLPLFTELSKLHAERAAFDARLLDLLADATAVDVALPSGALHPYSFARDGEIVLKPGDARRVLADSIPWAHVRLHGFSVLSDTPLPTSVQIGHLLIGGGINLLLQNDWCPLESHRGPQPTPLRETPEIRAPNTVEALLRNTGKTEVRFALIAHYEILDPTKPERPVPGGYAVLA